MLMRFVWKRCCAVSLHGGLAQDGRSSLQPEVLWDVILNPFWPRNSRKPRGSYAEAESSLARPQHTRMGTSGCLTAERVLLPKKKCLSARMHKQTKYHPLFSTIKVNQFPSMLNQIVDFMRSWLSRKLRGSRINLPTIRGSWNCGGGSSAEDRAEDK